MKKIVHYLMMLIVGLTVTSCYYDEIPAEDATSIPTTVSYTKDIQSLFDKNCISCHKTGSQFPDLTVDKSYAALTTLTNGEYLVIAGDASGSILYQSMIGKGAPLMPPGGALSATKLALVEKWINDGALNN